MKVKQINLKKMSTITSVLLFTLGCQANPQTSIEQKMDEQEREFLETQNEIQEQIKFLQKMGSNPYLFATQIRDKGELIVGSGIYEYDDWQPRSSYEAATEQTNIIPSDTIKVWIQFQNQKEIELNENIFIQNGKFYFQTLHGSCEISEKEEKKMRK